MTWFTVYLFSAMITGFALAGILVSGQFAGLLTTKRVINLMVGVFFPVVNTISAVAIVVLVVWLIGFSNPKPKSKPPR
jgi:ABC-type nitrate/sulfonate/bicarbonate transport system permease component